MDHRIKLLSVLHDKYPNKSSIPKRTRVHRKRQVDKRDLFAMTLSHLFAAKLWHGAPRKRQAAYLTIAEILFHVKRKRLYPPDIGGGAYLIIWS